MIWALVMTVWPQLDVHKNIHPNTDYVAVLTDKNNKPMLTALTSSENNRLWLQWQNDIVEPDTSIQLWARSRRDGEIRPLLVFDNQTANEIELNQAVLRLIKDSSDLLLTREELGGSAIDEPSDLIIAQGACVRLLENF